MKKNIVIFLLIIIIILLAGYIVWFNFLNNNKTIINDNIENGDNISSDESGDAEIDATNNKVVKEHNIVKLSQDKALELNKDINIDNLSTINWTLLKYGDNIVKKVYVNGRNIEFSLDIDTYRLEKSSGESGNQYLQLGYIVKGGFNEYFNGNSVIILSSKVNDITQIDFKKLLKDYNIKLGILKDGVTKDDYIVLYVENSDINTDSFYIISSNRELIYEGHYNKSKKNSNNYSGDIYNNIYPIEFYDNQILYYENNVETKISEYAEAYCETYDSNNIINIRHKLTIENDKVMDKIIKIDVGTSNQISGEQK